MAKTDKHINALVKELKTAYEGSLIFAAATDERADFEDSAPKINVVLSTITIKELTKFCELFPKFAEQGIQIGLFCTPQEIALLTKEQLVPLYTDCRVLFGDKNILPKIARSDIKNAAQSLAFEALAGCRAAFFNSDKEFAAMLLHGCYMSASYAVQYKYYLENSKFVASFGDLKNVCGDKEYVILDMAKNWNALSNDRLNEPDNAFLLLQQFCIDILTELSKL